MDPQLQLFKRQYFQLFEPDFLAWPPKSLLKDASVQSWLHANFFDPGKQQRLPPERYQLRVLKRLLSKIEQSIDDPQEEEVSDALLSHLSTLLSTALPSEAAAVQQKTFVTFSCLPTLTSTRPPDADPTAPEPTITLLERPHLISGSLTTGFRTWEAALHLGAYLLQPANAHLIADKNVLELGAGTGFLSILCAKHLAARHVTVTDGDEGVVEALGENLFLNGLDDELSLERGPGAEGERRVVPSVLRWGYGLRGSWVDEDCEAHPYDVVVGADITYDKTAIVALVATLRSLFLLRPQLLVFVAGAVRNAETFETFVSVCAHNKFQVREVDFRAPSIRDQQSLFYATAVPLKILEIRGPESVGDAVQVNRAINTNDENKVE